VRALPGSEIDGGLAQLGEHLLCKQGVVGSIPSSSTIVDHHDLDGLTSVSGTNPRFCWDLGFVFERRLLFFNNSKSRKSALSTESGSGVKPESHRAVDDKR